MKYTSIKKNIYLVAGLLLILVSCSKFLDKKPNQNLTTPATINDLSLLLDNYLVMNRNFPEAGEESADNYYLFDDGWEYALERTQNIYLWQKYDRTVVYWFFQYKAIMQANVILENLNKINVSPNEEKNLKEIGGMALFIRAYNHFSVSQLFMPVYNKATANDDLGIPLKLSPDMNEKIKRASSQATYDCIIKDIMQSIPNLPAIPVKQYRPSLPAAYGLLARVYLSMQEYRLAGLYADSCLKLYSKLIDFNDIDSLSDAPFDQFNEEVIYDTQSDYPDAFYQPDARVDSTLYKSYQEYDIRRSAFFMPVGDGTYNFKGNYTGKPYDPTMFTGIAVDEMVLTRVECEARAGDSLKAIQDLNFLLGKRYQNTYFTPYTLPVAGGLLQFILEERRKELLFRGLRWTDLRRLNKEPEFAVTLYRLINNQKYELLPGSDRYTLQIDYNSVLISGVQQNP